MLKRDHPGAPTWKLDRVDLVLYQLAQNDYGTLRLATPELYKADIVRNIRAIRTAWPGAKLLVTCTHLGDPPGQLYQQRLMTEALESLHHAKDADLHFVNTCRVLHDRGAYPQRSHPPEKTHDIWGTWIGEELRRLLEDETGDS